MAMPPATAPAHSSQPLYYLPHAWAPSTPRAQGSRCTGGDVFGSRVATQGTVTRPIPTQHLCCPFHPRGCGALAVVLRPGEPLGQIPAPGGF